MPSKVQSTMTSLSTPKKRRINAKKTRNSECLLLQVANVPSRERIAAGNYVAKENMKRLKLKASSDQIADLIGAAVLNVMKKMWKRRSTTVYKHQGKHVTL